MKIRIQNLKGAALDLAVAQAEGRVIHTGDWYGPYEPEATLKVSRLLSGNFDALCYLSGGVYSPSTNWHQGGPIIDEEGIETTCNLKPAEAKVFKTSPSWRASTRGRWHLDDGVWYGTSALQAAMRCFVALKLGTEVEIPEGVPCE